MRLRCPVDLVSEPAEDAEEEEDDEEQAPAKPTFVPLAPAQRTSKIGTVASGPVGSGPAEQQPTKIEEVGELFVIATVERDGTTEVLGMVPLVRQASEVARGFMANAELTDVIEVRIDAWTVGRIGADCVREHLVNHRETCPVCAHSTFWVEGERERGTCHDRFCRAWIAPNEVNPAIWNCGWPATMETEHSEDFDDAFEDLIAMKGRAEAAGSDGATELADDIASSI